MFTFDPCLYVNIISIPVGLASVKTYIGKRYFCHMVLKKYLVVKSGAPLPYT